MARIKKVDHLIIGNSAGCIGAVEAIRSVDKVGSVLIVSDEPYPAYSRPMISDNLASGCPLERMLYRPSDFYETNKISTILGDRVVQIDFNAYKVKLESGQALTWQKLLLATGGTPILPKIEGIGLDGTFTFNKLDDAKAIDGFLNRYTREVRVVVIGGGLIGVSVTEALIKRGAKVTIVEMKDRILNTILDEEASALEAEALSQAGVTMITGHIADKINSHFPGEAAGVRLDDGRLIPCDMIIVAIGVQPRLELVSGSNLNINRGIVVDRHMETSISGVYACGDVAEAYDFIYGENRLTPVWPNAYAGGWTAGLNMSGVSGDYPGGTSLNAMKYFGVNMVSAGMVIPPDDSYEVISIKRGDIYRKLVLKQGKIMGMVFADDIEKSGIIYNLMKERVNVNSFKEVLIADDFGLSSLPEKIWQAKLAMPASISGTTVTSIEQPEEVIIGE